MKDADEVEMCRQLWYTILHSSSATLRLLFGRTGKNPAHDSENDLGTYLAWCNQRSEGVPSYPENRMDDNLIEVAFFLWLGSMIW